jgi:hypothetical protein
MTHTQWQSSVQAKVATSWNLHTLLPRGLDFFVLLSSLAGVYGNVSQANYAAGNTFQDALAEFRTSQGEDAVSINLGWMRTIGAISEKEEYQNFRMKGADMAKIEEQELLSLLSIFPPGSVWAPTSGLDGYSHATRPAIKGCCGSSEHEIATLFNVRDLRCRVQCDCGQRR